MALFNPVVAPNYQPNAGQYQPYVPQYVAPQTNNPPASVHRNQSTGIVWVQGEAAAKSYPVEPGTTLLMLDSEDSVFYIKTVDASGMPMPLRVFEFTERSEIVHSQDTENFITRDEFEERLAELLRKEKNNETKKRQSTKGNIISSTE